MDTSIGNIDNILSRVDRLFSDNIIPNIQKTIEEQKTKITRDILTQIEDSFISRINRVESQGTIEPYFIPIYGENLRDYTCKLNPDNKDYDNEKLKKFTEEVYSDISDSDMFRIIHRINNEPKHRDWDIWRENYKSYIKLFKFIKQLSEGEYLVCVYIRNRYLDWFEEGFFITNFGSIYSGYYDIGPNMGNNKFLIFKNYNIIPKPILDILIGNFALNSKLCYNNNKSRDLDQNRVENFINFRESIVRFQKWYQTMALLDYNTGLLKKENEDLKSQICAKKY